MNYGRISAGSKLVALFQQFCERGLRITFDNQAFLFRPSFTLTAFRIRFFWHLSLISHKFLLGKKLVPRPGVGPGWSYPRECKSRLSTSSSTGAHVALNVGAVDPFKDSPVPTFSGPSSSALWPSSWSSPFSTSTRLY